MATSILGYLSVPHHHPTQVNHARRTSLSSKLSTKFGQPVAKSSKKICSLTTNAKTMEEGILVKEVTKDDADGVGIVSIHHIGLLCENLERSLSFYQNVLGLKINEARPHEKLPYRGAWLWVGSEMIHLMELPNPDPLTGRPAHGGRDHHACIAIQDVSKLKKVLDKAVIMSSHGSNAAASQSTSPSTCTPSTTTRRKPSKDIGWEYGTADPSVAGRVVCNLCKKVLNGGIRRLKEHLIGGLGNCTGCPGASIEIQKKVKEFMVSKKEQAISRKKIQMAINMRDDVFEIDDDDVDPKKDDEPMILGSTGGSAILSGSGGGGVSNLRKRDARTFLKTNVKGPLDTLLMPDPSKKMKQKCLDDDNPHKQKLRDVACEKIAIWSYEAGVAFNAFRLSSFQTMVNAIGYYGKDMPAPTYHEMRTTLLKVVYEKQKAFVDSFRGYWATYGCSIMADWWTDGKQRTLINFLVNCPQGTVFLKSIDGSDFKKDHTLIVDYINEVIKEVGEENIVQFITDNASNFKTAGAVLEGQHPTMFWTPCAAHCVNLMLQDIAKSSSKIKNVLVEARAIVVYIYNHGRVLNLMRQFTNGELHRSAVTRFATSFYTLQSLHKNKQALRKMFVCDKWVKSDFAKKLDGKHVQHIIARGAFWDNVLYACRIMAPLVDIIRLVDTEEKPCMGYIYEGLDRAKEQIEKNLGESLRRTTNKIWAIIDKRWETQLHHPLHAAGFYLNPAIYYKHTTLAIEGNAEIKRGLRKAISKLVPNEDENDRVFDQLADFREVKGDFGDPRAIRRRETLQPCIPYTVSKSGRPAIFARDPDANALEFTQVDS